MKFIPIYASAGITGFESPAAEYAELALSLDQLLIDHPWGVGRRISKRLQQGGINTALLLSNVKPSTMRSEFSSLLEQTVHELNGEVRLSWDEVRSPKKQIYSTLSFGQRVTTADELRQSIVQHCSIVAEKLRKQGSLSTNMLVFAQSSIHDQNSFFKRSALHEFSSPTSDTNVMAKANACTGLIHRLYCPGVRYYKSGVGVLDLVDEHQCQLDMFDVSQDNKKLMTQIDAINQRFGKNTLFVGSKGIDAKFAMRREMLSKRYTTRLSELPVISCR